MLAILLHTEHGWRTILLFMVGVLIVIVLIDALAESVMKRLNDPGRTKWAERRKQKRDK
jgi:hypothetical protein